MTFSEFEPALSQTIANMSMGLFVVNTGEFYPTEPVSKTTRHVIDLTEQTMVSNFSAEKLESISHKIDVIMATISLALIPYKDN